MNHARQILACLLLLFSSSAAASTDELHHAIAQAHWGNALYHYQRTPVSQSVPLLKLLAENNVVMAQWFLADALAKTGQPQEATRWLYTASLGTRMDSKVCRASGADTVEYRFVHVFSDQFSPLRANDEYRRHGLTQALAFHSSKLGKSSHADWVCRLLAHESPRRARVLTTAESRWMNSRQAVFKDYREQSGLGQARTPDLIRINPVVN